jgi:hypothetical protein
VVRLFSLKKVTIKGLNVKKTELSSLIDLMLQAGARTKTPKQRPLPGQPSKPNSMLIDFELSPNQLTK